MGPRRLWLPLADAARNQRMPPYPPGDQLWNPRVNVRLGLHFLKRLIERYDGQVEYALSYYNGGSAVGPPSRPRIIPATRPYVQKVIRLQGRYRRKLSRGEI